MTRKIPPAAGPNSRTVITTKANLCGWTVQTGPVNDEGVTELTLTRDQWRIVVALHGQIAFGAALRYPGQSNPSDLLSLSELGRYLRGNRVQMSAFVYGQRVIVGDKTGTVQKIVPQHDERVRLVVKLDSGTFAEPFTTHVHAEGGEAA